MAGQMVTTPEGRIVELLPGCEYQTCLIPLDYAPSRDYRSRWGRSRAPIAALEQHLRRTHREFIAAVREMKQLAPFFARIPTKAESPEASWMGGPMNALDLAFIYYFVSKMRPEKYVEIGSGISTCFAKRAVRDHQLSTKIISIDPQPRTSVDAICDHVYRDGLETLQDLSIFESLNAGDIVFMDGSHRVFMNSDVTVFLLEIIPMLKNGVIIHFHDIFLPYDYPEMFHNWYWSEQYMLAAYLLGATEHVKILMPCVYVCQTPGLKETLEPVFVEGVDPGVCQNGGSFWFTKI